MRRPRPRGIQYIKALRLCGFGIRLSFNFKMRPRPSKSAKLWLAKAIYRTNSYLRKNRKKIIHELMYRGCVEI